MATTTPLGMMSHKIPLPQTTKYFFSSSNNKKPTQSYNNNNIKINQFICHKRLSYKNRNLGYHCYCNLSDNNISVSPYEWDWNHWLLHFSEIEQAESSSAILKFQLEEAVEQENFQEAAKLKSALAEATSKDAVAEIMSELKKAIGEERYLDASKLSRSTGSGLVGWWIGSAKDSEDPFGRLLRITPGVGKFIGRSYTPRQLITASPGTTLFEIYVVKNTDGAYAMQVVYLQRSKRSSTISANLQPKPTRDSSDPASEEPSTIKVETKEDKGDKQERKVLNIEGATEEGIKSVIKFIKDKIPGLKIKVMNVSVGEDGMDDSDSVEQLTDGDYDETDEDSDSEVDNLDEVKNEIEKLTMEGSDDSLEDEKDVEMKVFVSGIVHNEDDVLSKEEYILLPAEIEDAEKESFTLHIPGISRTEESKAPDDKIAAIAGVSEFMPSDIAKAFFGADKISPKISRDVREIFKFAVSQAQKRNVLTEYTHFNRIAIPQGKFDPFNGLYVGAFGPYGTELVQLRRKFGHWNSGNEESSDVEFYEYVEAVKLTGDLNVPAGQVTFRAKIGKGSRLSSRGMYPDELGVVGSYKGQGRIAGFGFKNPKWVEGELLQLNGKQGVGPYFRGADLGFLYIVPEQSFLVLFNRLNLPE